MSWAGAYAASARWHEGWRRVADIVHAGVWLGLLDRPDLHAIDQIEYEKRATYRTDAHNLSGLFEWERRMIDQHFPAAGPLVVVGAGGGREVLALAARGHPVVGYECNPVLVAAGRDLLRRTGGSGAALHLLDRDAAPRDHGPYVAAVVGWSAYMLMPGRASRVSFLTGLREVLARDAPVLLSFASRTAAERRPALLAAVANPIRRVRGRRPVELGDDLAPNYVHRFTEQEIDAELSDSGYRLRHFAAGRPATGETGHAVACVR